MAVISSTSITGAPDLDLNDVISSGTLPFDIYVDGNGDNYVDEDGNLYITGRIEVTTTSIRALATDITES